MQISDLSEATGVPVPTVKYYLRERLLHPGVTVSRTRARYDASHVERLTLVRALTEVGGLSLAAARRVLAAIEEPDLSPVDVMAVAQRSLPGVAGARPAAGTSTTTGAYAGRDHEAGHDLAPPCDAPGAPDSRSRRFVAGRGWQVHPGDPVLDELDAAWEACDRAGLGLDEERMTRYADAVEQIGRTDVESVPQTSPQAAVRHVVLGTVLVDPVLAALRRLAQQHVAVSSSASARSGMLAP
ncbi:MerR family transcriptional regulator [uncultured Serinicoccus sp.]|uniref:MerR family transcriptional regulator n=1 Tax=uncultured Serinicoccus sp. TaxID=735514 RepID=UPI002616E148|nr:MerR family transcriptional regulator [uncultured Serinicoccus sp.]